jgi:hypothetical protein
MYDLTERIKDFKLLSNTASWTLQQYLTTLLVMTLLITLNEGGIPYNDIIITYLTYK